MIACRNFGPFILPIDTEAFISTTIRDFTKIIVLIVYNHAMIAYDNDAHESSDDDNMHLVEFRRVGRPLIDHRPFASQFAGATA